MRIRQATVADLAVVEDIVRRSILTVYPKYYSQGIVDFFLFHHRDETVASDMQDGKVFLLEVENQAVATVTVDDNEINRLFVLPLKRGHGYGDFLLSFAEERVKKGYQIAYLASSLPAEAFYLKRSYEVQEEREHLTESGEILHYKYLYKKLHN